MGKVMSIGGGKRFAVGASLRGYGKFADKQWDAYVSEVGAVNNFADGSLGAQQFGYTSKGNKAAREAAVMALAQVKVNYGQMEVAA